MYTVKELAEKLDVSQTTIYNHLQKNEKELKGQITKRKGITYVKDEGLNILKVSLGIIQVPTIKENVSLDESIKKIYDLLQTDTNKKFDDLQEELKEIKEQNKILIDMIQEKEKKGLFDKLKDLFK